MTLASTQIRESYQGNGVVTAFSYPYYFMAAADIVVILETTDTGTGAITETLLTLGTDYTVTGTQDPSTGFFLTGGTINIPGGSTNVPAILASNQNVTILRAPAEVQETDYVDNYTFTAETLEASLDRLTMFTQRLQDLANRSVRLTDGNTETFNPSLPNPLTADCILQINAAGDGLSLGPTVDQISNDAAAAAAAATSAATASAAAASAQSAATASAASAASSASSASTAATTATTAQGACNTAVTNAQTAATNAANSATAAAASAAASGGFTNPMTTVGDLILGGASGAAGRLGIGSTGQVLTVSGGTAAWAPAPAGGGGGAGFVWKELSGTAPVKQEEDSEVPYFFGAGLSQELYAAVKIPSSYVSGTQIKILVSGYSPSTSNTILFQAQSTLIRKNTDAFDSVTNQRTTTNSALTNTVANQVREFSLDITDTAGKINGVAASAGDVIKVRLYRGSDSDTADLRMLPNATDAKFS